MGGQLMLSLSILIVLHEMGHFFTARWFGTRVEKFYLFFDPWFELFKIKRGDTEYGIGWLPLGGYVKISGMIDESFDKEQMQGEPQPWEFRSKPAWQRLIIMLGGVIVNFILGFFLYGMVLWTWGEEYLPAENVTAGIYADELGQELGLRTGDKILSVGGAKFEKFNEGFIRREISINNATTIEVIRNEKEVSIPVDPKWTAALLSYENKDKPLFFAQSPFVVAQVTKGSPAEETDLQPWDKIVGLDREATPYFTDFLDKIKDKKNQVVELNVVRPKNKDLDYTDAELLPPMKVKTTEEARIGVAALNPGDIYGTKVQNYTFAEAMPLGVVRGYDFLALQIKAFGQIFRGKVNASDSLGGFGSIGKMFGNSWDWHRFWQMTAILSLILAFMNLLPIPALDGGHVMFLLYEMVTGNKPSDRFLEISTMIGFVIVIGLVLFANGMDIYRWLTGK